MLLKPSAGKSKEKNASMNAKDVLKKLQEEFSSNEKSKRKIAVVLKPTTEQIAAMAELDKQGDEIRLMERKLINKRNMFWANLSEHFNEFREMQWKDEDNTIEVYED